MLWLMSPYDLPGWLTIPIALIVIVSFFWKVSEPWRKEGKS